MQDNGTLCNIELVKVGGKGPMLSKKLTTIGGNNIWIISSEFGVDEGFGGMESLSEFASLLISLWRRLWSCVVPWVVEVVVE